MRFAASLVLAAVSLATVAPAGAGEALSVERLWEVKRVGQSVLAPDGRRVAFTVTAYDVQENRANADIWLSSLDASRTGRIKHLLPVGLRGRDVLR